MSDQLRTNYGQVTTRDMRHLRRKPMVKELVEKGEGFLTDQSLQHQVKVVWNLNERAQRDRIFKLQIDDKVVYLDLEELTFYTRVMFQD